MSKQSRPIQIVHLYPSEMNIYGDTGNRLILEKRLSWRGIPFETHLVHLGDSIPKDADIIIGGGGQDASQGEVATDLQAKKGVLQSLADNGCVMLMVCGMYQLFGRRFVTASGSQIDGVGIFSIETLAEPGRLIGNIVVSIDGAGSVVGYENHSGRTYLDDSARALGSVTSGKGNNDETGLEGCRVNNVFGTYMHGPILSKNPKFADMLLDLALKKHGHATKLVPLDDTLELQAQSIALKRPR